MSINLKISNNEILVARKIPRSTRLAIYLSGTERQVGIFFLGLMIILILFGWLHSPFSDNLYFAKGRTAFTQAEVTFVEPNDYNKAGDKVTFRYSLKGKELYLSTSVVETRTMQKFEKTSIEYNLKRPEISRIVGEARYVGSKGIFALIWATICFVLAAIFIRRRLKNVFYGIELLQWGEVSLGQIIYEKKQIAVEKRDVYLPNYVFYTKDGTDFSIRMSPREIEEENYTKVMPILYTELMEKCLLLQQIPGNVKFNHNWEIEDKDKAELKKVLMLPFIMMGLITIMWGYLLFYTL